MAQQNLKKKATSIAKSLPTVKLRAKIFSDSTGNVDVALCSPYQVV